MKGIKCPQCGLVYWNTEPSCKRCGLATGESPEGESQASVPQAATQPVVHSESAAEEQLLRNLKRDSRLFYFIGGLQALAWFIIGQLLIVDAVLNIGLSFLAYKFRSRVAATFLLLLTMLGVMVGILTIALGGIKFSPLIPLILLGRLAVSARMVYTTIKLNRYRAEDFVTPPPPPVFHPEEAPQWNSPVVSAQ